MSISGLFDDNSYNLKAKSLTVTSDIEGGRDLTLRPSVDEDGDVTGNASINFASTGSSAGTPFVTSSANEIRFGSNSAGAGIKFTNMGAGTGNISVAGTVTASNIPDPSLRGEETWSGGGASLTVSAVGMTAGHHVFVTVHAPATEAVEVSHVVAQTDQFTVNLTGSNSSNDMVLRWFALGPIA